MISPLTHRMRNVQITFNKHTTHVQFSCTNTNVLLKMHATYMNIGYTRHMPALSYVVYIYAQY